MKILPFDVWQLRFQRVAAMLVASIPEVQPTKNSLDLFDWRMSLQLQHDKERRFVQVAQDFSGVPRFDESDFGDVNPQFVRSCMVDEK